MELTETVESINTRLVEEFGYEFGNQPRFRLVFSEDQYEKRWTNYTDEGFELINPEVRELPKYKQFISEKWILERLVPVAQPSDLIEQISYEPAWVFMDSNGNYLPPYYEGCKFVIEAIMTKMGQKGHTRYSDPTTAAERRQAEIAKVSEELFGDETKEGDALQYGYGVTDFNQKVELPSGKEVDNAS